MPRPSKAPPRSEDLPTIWEVPDTLWGRIAPIIADLDPPKATGRPRIDARRALEAILFRLRSDCQWKHLPKDLPEDSSVHRTFQRWTARGIFDRIWAHLVDPCAELGGVNWEWQAADGAMGKARLGGSHRPQPYRPWEARGEAQHAGGGDGWPAGRRNRGRQHPRHQALDGDLGGDCGGAAAADSGAAAAPLLG